MRTSQSVKSEENNVQPHSDIDTVDLLNAPKGLSKPACARLGKFFDKIIENEVLNARVSEDADSVRIQLQTLSGVEEYREDTLELSEALKALQRLTKDSPSNFNGLTVPIVTEHYRLDVSWVHLASAHGDQWVIRAREVDPVPIVLDTLGLSNDELRHVRAALSEKRGLVSIGTPRRRHLEDWHRAVCRELSSPDRSVVSLAPRLLEDFPRVAQTILPSGERWDQRLWQLAGHAEADVIVLCDDGTHGYSPDQLGILAERCLIVQILQTPDICSLANRTPAGPNIHRVVMHLPVRRLCGECSEPHQNPSRVEYSFLDRGMPTLSDGVSAWLSATQAVNFKKACGCPSCTPAGYKAELCVVDSIGDPSALMNIAELVDEHTLTSDRIANLLELARCGDICLNEVRRLITG